MSPTPDEVAAELDTAKKLVEEVLERLGLDPAKVRGESGPDRTAWSIPTRLGVHPGQRRQERTAATPHSCSAVSPIMSLPPDAALLPSSAGSSS